MHVWTKPLWRPAFQLRHGGLACIPCILLACYFPGQDCALHPSTHRLLRLQGFGGGGQTSMPVLVWPVHGVPVHARRPVQQQTTNGKQATKYVRINTYHDSCVTVLAPEGNTATGGLGGQVAPPASRAARARNAGIVNIAKDRAGSASYSVCACMASTHTSCKLPHASCTPEAIHRTSQQCATHVCISCMNGQIRCSLAAAAGRSVKQSGASSCSQSAGARRFS